MALVLYFLAAFGLAFILGASKISLPARYWLAGAPDVGAKPGIKYIGPFVVALAECPGCLGWWIGCTVGAQWPEFIVLNAPGIDSITESWWGLGVLLGLATAATNMVVGKVVGIVE